MASNWRRSLGNVRSFIGNSLGGLRGGSNLASWVVAGTLAYYLWVKPSQDLKREQQERAALAAASDPYRYVEKRRPIPDPQLLVKGLIQVSESWLVLSLSPWLLLITTPSYIILDKIVGCCGLIYYCIISAVGLCQLAPVVVNASECKMSYSISHVPSSD